MKFIEQDNQGSDHWVFECNYFNFDDATENQFSADLLIVAKWCQANCEHNSWGITREVSTCDTMSLNAGGKLQSDEYMGNDVTFTIIISDTTAAVQFKLIWC